MRHIITISRLSWVVEFEANCPLMEPGSIGGMLFVWVFLKDPSPYIRENHQRKKKQYPYTCKIWQMGTFEYKFILCNKRSKSK